MAPENTPPAPSGMFPPLTGREAFVFVMNTGSGKGKADEIQAQIDAILSGAHRRYQLMPVSDGSELVPTAERAVAVARRQGGIVVAVGGDGTLNAVSQAVLGSGVPFGILPQGTFNYFGRNYGIPQETEMAARCLLDARIEPVSVGMLNGRVFLVNASLGLYPSLLEDREAYKQRYGRSRLVALASALVTLARAHRQLNVRLEFEGEVRHLRTPTIVVGNNPLQLEHIGVDEVREIARNHLVMMTSRPVGTLALYGLLLRGLMSRLGEADNVITVGFEKMMVRPRFGRRPIKVAMDGEIFWLRPPLEFKVAEQKLPLLVPRDPTARDRS